MKTGPRSLIALLEAARRDRADLVLSDFPPEEVRWAVASGLGPWMRRCTAADPQATTSPLWPLVQGADLTARVLMAEQLDAAEEIVAPTGGHIPTLTLLKGIALCGRQYPEPHLRSMGDIDILVDDDAVAVLRSRLVELGYRPQSHPRPGFYETHHHIAPMFHSRRRVWVEVHRGLFPPSSGVSSDEVFGPERIASERQPFLFRGHRVHRLSDELELVYLASHWAFELKRERGLTGILDVTRLLGNARLAWPRLLPWLEGTRASAYVCLLLTYLVRRGLADLEPAVLEDLWRRQRVFGHANLRVLHTIVDRHVVEGRAFDRVVSERTFRILWDALLSPGRPSRNLLKLGWGLLPSRRWLARALGARG